MLQLQVITCALAIEALFVPQKAYEETLAWNCIVCLGIAIINSHVKHALLVYHLRIETQTGTNGKLSATTKIERGYIRIVPQSFTLFNNKSNRFLKGQQHRSGGNWGWEAAPSSRDHNKFSEYAHITVQFSRDAFRVKSSPPNLWCTNRSEITGRGCTRNPRSIWEIVESTRNLFREGRQKWWKAMKRDYPKYL